MTAKEYFNKFLHKRSHTSISLEERNEILEAMKEFAQHHVNQALIEAANNARIDYIDTGIGPYEEIDKDSILNCYKDKIQ